MKRKITAFLLLFIASLSLYAGVVYYGSGRAVFLENIIQFANFFEIEATGIKNLRLGGEVKAHNVQAANVDKNFIPFGGFETGDEDFTSYVDAAGVLPVDGTGGGPSSFLTCAQSATSPLEGDGSLNMVKFNTSSGGQGHGCSYDFTVSTAGQAQGMTLSFDYKWTDVAANEDNDFIVYLYDVDKSQLVAPVPYEIKKSQYVTKFISGFMTDATSTNYRLIFHLAQDRAGIFSLKVDNLFVGKSTYARGSPITDWVSYTPTVTVASGTVPPELVFSGKWRRVGSHMEIKVFANWTGAPAAAFVTPYVRIPIGHNIDYSALGQDQTTETGERNGGIGVYMDAGVTEYQVRTKVNPSSVPNTFSLRPLIQLGTTLIGVTNITESIPFAPGAGDYLNASISVPISGWSSNVVMSETMPGRDVVLVLEGNGSTQSIAGGTVVKATNWAVVKNPANIWNASTSEATIPETGYYSLSSQVRFADDADADIIRAVIQIFRNGVQYKATTGWAGSGGTYNTPLISVGAAYFQKGDLIDIRVFQNNGDNDALNTTGAAETHFFTLAKLNTGNQTIGLEETVLQKVSVMPNPNLLINGGFDLWQRGTSQTTSGFGSDDRWNNNHNGSTKTASRQLATATERAFFNSTYFSRTVVSSSAGASNQVRKFTYIENVSLLAGRTVTLSFWAKADATKNVSIEIGREYGTSGSPTAFDTAVVVRKIGLTATWEKKILTFTIPSLAGKTLGTDGPHTSGTVLYFWFDAGTGNDARTASLGQQSGTFDIAEVKLEIGSVATPFSLAGGNIAGELAMAQRYYEQSYSASVAAGTVTLTGALEQLNNRTGAAGVFFDVQYKATKRIAAPVVTIYSPDTGASGNLRDRDGAVDVVAVTTSANEVGFNITNNAAIGGADRRCAVHWTASAEF